ncbi:S-adenosyl-L-methionine-dependent methyltransferase [Ophiobolus disseminans]|uniref:S-adenosyl-L-methionine-dependent methyltransferase n=1 Tax=Ophiobolus disseminans TaxID=1469910 RepID=A0A6A7A2Z0_9PLEO|nr:S-adenosyl-L-methionine-dependent methyltransferase [Ophiobolus disseminans]
MSDLAKNDPSTVNPNDKDTNSKWGTASKTSACRYSRTNLCQHAIGESLTQMMNIAKDHSVLVVGCGPGKDSITIAHLVGPGGRVVGMDLDRHSIDQAKENLEAFPELKLRVEYHAGDAHDLSRFAGQTFDHIHVNATYHWFTNKPLFLAQAAFVSKAGTCIGIATADGSRPSPIVTIREDILTKLGEDTTNFAHIPTQDELRHDLAAAGFGRVYISRTYNTSSQDSATALLDWIEDSSGNMYLNHLEQDRRVLAREMILEEVKGLSLPDGGLIAQFTLLNAIAYWRGA